MKIGFTGTQTGMTHMQKRVFERLLHQFGCTEFHHGDCIGADSDAHKIARTLAVPWIVIHPPTDPRKRAFCKANLVRPEKAYILRNHDIVNDTDTLIATPKEDTEQLRSGTWATIRYANKTGKRVIIIYPLGKIENSHANKGGAV